MPERKARVERNTSETKIVVELNLDGSGKYDICLLYTSPSPRD